MKNIKNTKKLMMYGLLQHGHFPSVVYLVSFSHLLLRFAWSETIFSAYARQKFEALQATVLVE